MQDNNTDAEMQLLDNLYQQVIAGGGFHNGYHDRFDIDTFRSSRESDLFRFVNLLWEIIQTPKKNIIT